MILRLIEQFPDLACRLLGHIGMVRANDVVYELGWNQRREMSDDGVETHDCCNAEVPLAYCTQSTSDRNKTLTYPLRSCNFGRST
jgi:hypothetical protein